MTPVRGSDRARPYDRPNVGIWMAVVEPDSVVEFARTAEQMGCDSVWVPEHLIWPETIESRYPYQDSGALPVPSSVNLYDPWALLSAVAAVTSTIRLGTCVYVLPLRDPFVTARAVTTLDVVSRGRAILGAGLGWMAEEFDAAGISFRTRASRTDEIVPILRSLWTQELTEANGRHFQFKPVHFYPKPPQGARLPIIFGGEGEFALKRAARLGDGWIGTWHTPESTAAVVAELEGLLAGYERTDPFEVTVMVRPRLMSVKLVEQLYAAGADRVCVGSPRVPLNLWPEILENIGAINAELAERYGPARSR